MPATTCAGAKRLRGESAKCRKQARRKVKDIVEDNNAANASGSQSTGQFRFLDLPAEIRNRIYEFARENEYDGDNCPPLLTRAKKPKKKHSKDGARAFLALTQTCTQIRMEYRPLWLRTSSVRIKYQSLTGWIKTFYETPEKYENAPELIQISWSHDKFYRTDDPLDINLLFQLRAHRPALRVQFVAHKMFDLPVKTTDRDGFETDANNSCEHTHDCSCNGGLLIGLVGEEWDGTCGCTAQNWHYRAMVDAEYDYLDWLNAFLE